MPLCKSLRNLGRGISLFLLGECIFRFVDIIIVVSSGLSKGTTLGSQEKLNLKYRRDTEFSYTIHKIRWGLNGNFQNYRFGL